MAVLGVPPMSHRILKGIGLIFGAVLLAALVLSAFLLHQVGRDERDDLIQNAVSPDGKLVAELRENIKGPWGGSDTLYVTIRAATHPFGDKVYSRTYECMDHGAFHVQWEGSSELIIAYGSCDTGRWHTEAEDKVWNKDVSWHDVKITYEDTKYVATR
jgi:hypothetical protein